MTTRGTLYFCHLILKAMEIYCGIFKTEATWLSLCFSFFLKDSSCCCIVNGLKYQLPRVDFLFLENSLPSRALSICCLAPAQEKWEEMPAQLRCELRSGICQIRLITLTHIPQISLNSHSKIYFIIQERFRVVSVPPTYPGHKLLLLVPLPS